MFSSRETHRLTPVFNLRSEAFRTAADAYTQAIARCERIKQRSYRNAGLGEALASAEAELEAARLRLQRLDRRGRPRAL